MFHRRGGTGSCSLAAMHCNPSGSSRVTRMFRAGGPAEWCSLAADTMAHPRFRGVNAGHRTVHAAFQAVEAPFRTSTAGFGSPGPCLRTSLARFRAVERRFRNRETRDESTGTRSTAFGTRENGSDLRGAARTGAAVTKKTLDPDAVQRAAHSAPARLQGLASLAAPPPPPRYNTAPRWPATIPYRSRSLPGARPGRSRR